MKSIGIDISKNGIAIVELNADRNFYEIVAGEFLPLNPVDDSNWELDVLQTLKPLTQHYDFKNSIVCVGLSQSSVSSRNVQFPFIRRTDIMKSLPFELDEELPLSIDDAVFDGKIIAQNASTTSPQTSLLAYAAPKEAVGKWIELFEKIDIIPDIVSVESSAFANLFENFAGGSFLTSAPDTLPSPLTVRLMFRHETTLMTAFHGSQMVWARNISWGEKNIILEIMKTFNYPYEQAAQLIPDQLMMVLNKNTAAQEEATMSECLENAMAEFIHTLNLSLIDLKDRFNTGVDGFYLLGPLGQISNMSAHLTRYIGLPVNSESLAQNVFQPRQISRVSAIVEKIPIAVGYALEGLKRPKNPAINFRQGEFAKNSQFWADTWSKWGYGLTLCAIAYGIYTVYGVVREEVALQLDTTTYEALEKSAGTIANLRGNEASPDRIERYLERENEKAKNAKVFEKVQDIEPAMKVVSALSTLLPSNKAQTYDIRRVDVKGNSIIIEGEAVQPNTVEQIRKKLETLSSDKRTQKVPTTFTGAKGVAFAFKINTKETL